MSFHKVSKETPITRMEGGGSKALQVSFAVFNQARGRWETPRINQGEQDVLKNVVDSLLFSSDPTLQKLLSQEGVVVDITREGIWIQKDGEWVDLLSEKNISQNTKNEIKKTLSAVTGFIGDLSKTRQKFTAKQAPQAAPQVEKGVVIEVKVLSFEERFKSRYDKEHQFHQSVQESLNQLKMLDFQEHLKAKGVSEKALQELIEAHEKFAAAVKDMDDLMQAVNEALLDTGEYIEKQRPISRYKRAYDIYFDGFDKLHAYRNALISFEGIQNNIVETLKKDPAFEESDLPLCLQLKAKNRIAFHVDVFKEFVADCSKRDAQAVKQNIASTAVRYGEALDTNYQRIHQFNETTRNKIRKLLDQEIQFKQQVDQYVKDLSDESDLIYQMRSNGFSSKECEECRKDFKAWQKIEAKMSALLLEVDELSSRGLVQEAFDHYAETMEDFLATYQQQAEKIAMWQKIASDRLPGRVPLFNLGLGQLSAHAALFQSVLGQVKAHPMVTPDGDAWLNTEAWNACLQTINEAAAAIKQAADYPPFSNMVSALLARNKAYERQASQFIKRFKEERKEFESLMQAGGYSGLETAYLFNHLETAYEELMNWNRGFQKVVDLSNRKQYKEAMELYASLMREEYPKLVEAMETLSLVAVRWEAKGTDLQMPMRFLFERFMVGRGAGGVEKTRVQQEARKNAEEVWHTILSMKDLGLKLFVEYRDATLLIEDLLEEETEPSASWLQALGIAEEALNTAQEHVVGNQRLYMPGGFLRGLFHLDLNKSQAQAWSKTLNAYGWKEKNASAVDRVMQEYAEMIKPLRQAHLAIENEISEEKKRVLRSQLRALASKAMPRIAELRKRFEDLGGIRKIRLLQQAAQTYIKEGSDLRKPKDLQQRVEAAAQLYEDRLIYTDNLYKYLNLKMFLEEEQVSRPLLGFPNASDPNWRKVIHENGWNLQEIGRFCRLYDEYLQRFEVLQLARAELDRDPDNLLLQEEFYRVYEKQLPQMSRIANQLQAMGGMQKLKSLDRAVGIYSQQLIEKRDAYIEDLQSASRRNRPFIEKEIYQLNMSISLLAKIEVAEKFGVIESEVVAIHAFAQHGLNWNASYFKPLFDTRSPLMGFTVRGKKIWPDILKKNHLTIKDLQAIDALQMRYQKELSSMRRLNDQLSIQPADNKLRDKLVQELKKRASNVRKLEKEYEQLSPQIARLNVAMGDLSNRLEHISTDSTEMRAIRDMSEGIDVLGAFGNKRRLMFQLYTEYHLLHLLQH